MGTRFDILKGTVDLLTGVVESAAGAIPLTANEVALLGALHDASPEAVRPEVLLTEALGYAASAKSRTVTVSIQRLRKKIESDPSEPRSIVTVRGEGYALRYGETRVQAPPTPASAPPGREADCIAIEAAFQAGACPVVLVGPGGVGKTTLAQHWRNLEKAHWVDLFGVTDSGSLRRRLTVALDLEKQADADAALRERFSAGPAIVLDNAEDLDAEGRAALEAWLKDGARVLVTSQTPLGLSRETVVVLEGVDRDTAGEVLAEVRRRAGLPPLDVATQEALHQRFGGHPLALVIAAPIAEFLDDEVHALDMPSEATATHHRTLSEGVGRTFARLDAEVVDVAAALATFPGSATLQSLSQVADRPLPFVLKSVVSLRGCGLLRHEERQVDLIPMARTLLRHDREYAPRAEQARAGFIGWLHTLSGSLAELKRFRADLEHGLSLTRGTHRLPLLYLHLEMLYSFGPVDDIEPQAQQWTADFPLSLRAEAQCVHAWGMTLGGSRTEARDRLIETLEGVTHPETLARGASILGMMLSWRREDRGIYWARRALAALDETCPDYLRAEVGTHAGYTLASLGEPDGFEVLEDAIQLAAVKFPARALTAALSKARLTPASTEELQRCRRLLAMVGDGLGSVQRAVDTADFGVILLDANHVEEAWELLDEARRLLNTHQPMLSTILINAATRLVDQPQRALLLLEAVGPSIDTKHRAFVIALMERDRATLKALGDPLHGLGEAYLDGEELPECTRWFQARRALQSVRNRTL